MFYKKWFINMCMISFLIFNPQTMALCLPQVPNEIICAGIVTWTSNSSSIANLVFRGLEITNNNPFKVVCSVSGRIAKKTGKDQSGYSTPNCSSAPVEIDTHAKIMMNEYAGIQCITTDTGGDFNGVGKPTSASPLLLTCTNLSAGVSRRFQVYSSSETSGQGFWTCSPF